MTQSSKSNPLDQESMASVLGKRARPTDSAQGMQQHNVLVASLSNATKNIPPPPLASSAEPISTLQTMRMSTRSSCTMSETMQSAMEWTCMSWTIPSIFQAALFQSSPLRSEKESRCLQVRPMVKEKRTLFFVCPAPVCNGFAANVVSRRRGRHTASNTQNTTAPRCSIKASTHYPSSPSGSRWKAIDPAHTSDTFHPKQCLDRVQLCASAVHKERETRSLSRT